MCFVIVLGWLLPRVTLALLAFFSDWTHCLRPGWLGIVGWLLLPYTTLAYVIVHHLAGTVDMGQFAHLLGIAFGVLCDLGAWGGGHRMRRD